MYCSSHDTPFSLQFCILNEKLQDTITTSIQLAHLNVFDRGDAKISSRQQLQREKDIIVFADDPVLRKKTDLLSRCRRPYLFLQRAAILLHRGQNGLPGILGQKQTKNLLVEI
jgi:hypothetical protein